ncbi:MAG: pentapeptide repeat-containing protein [bacterium]
MQYIHTTVLFEDHETYSRNLFSHDDYSDMIFTDVTLKNCRLSHMNFTHVHFTSCAMINVVFEHCDLSNCVLKSSLLRQVSFKNCKMMGLSIDDSIIDQVSLIDCQARYFNLSFIKNRGLLFDHVDLTNSFFNTCEMAKTRFRTCLLNFSLVNKRV